ncbi:MAG: alkaline phosphatase family protein [Planctomycetes bacterium]|jgi:alkaline phosphatase D|nr:alkaline phosphatase family protein [Planctomycetota bacterium]
MKRSLVAGWVLGVVAAQDVTLTHGPLQGHVDTTSIHAWARASAPGTFVLELLDRDGRPAKQATATASLADDLTLHFAIDGLAPGASFGLRIRATAPDAVVHEAIGAGWTTSIGDDAPRATIAFGSCADERGKPEQPIWGQITARRPDALVLLGDTPYIDDGSIAARRRRHREFLAFAPVARTLAVIPTWTVWDDHDYATNDAFGAAKGSDTAREVFVAYHAHAGYGDGARGIYTRFRRGPVEVFVLDARTFADTETSPLAPGERSLLGSGQLQWLQQWLAASKATWKVLACGMVWNDGVRPKKRDCWGNWAAERDALFRWLGAQRIEGVVLVSGDVHRSRVILHPTAALVGYDIPELVTSPLAQNVIESNKVAVPGLEFDAGEPESCMVLTADHGVDRDALVATFVAGDGREFHRRAFAAHDLRRGDAAAVYRRMETLLRGAFGADLDGLPEDDHQARGRVDRDAAVGPTWRAAVAAAAPALAEWGRATAIPNCRFGPRGEKEGAPEFFDRLVGIRSLQTLAMARGYQAITDRDETKLLATCSGLLVLARQLCDEPTCIAWLMAFEIESCAAHLTTVASAEWPATAEALRGSLQQHLAVRPAVGAFVVPAEQQAMRLLDIMLRGTDQEPGVRGELFRRHGVDSRRFCIDAIAAQLAPLARLADRPDPAVRDELNRMQEELRQRFDEVWARLKKRTPTDPAQPTDAADTATLLVGLVLPPTTELYDRSVATWEELRAVAGAR